MRRRHRLSVKLLASAAILAVVPHLVDAADAVKPSVGLVPPREFLALYDIDEQKLATFHDNQPLDAPQRELMLKLLLHLQRYPLTAIDEFSQSPDAVAGIVGDLNEARGRLFTLTGQVTRVTPIKLDAADAERLQFGKYYRCRFETKSGQSAVICTLAVPDGWKRDAAIDHRASARAMFLKLLPRPDSAPNDREAERDAAINSDADTVPEGAEATAPVLLFVARRVGWHPDTVLGRLGMDVGLLDDVADREGLAERECFYQLLAAVRRANETALEQEARDQLAREATQLRRQADDSKLKPAQRAAARRALEQAEQGSSDVVPLFNDPTSRRGALVTLRGEALRAVEVRVDDPDVVRRFGIRRYYEVEMLTGDSQNNPIVCCVVQLPDGMPLGDNISVGVRVTGFFLKSWAYRLGRPGQATDRRQLAPLVIAKTLTRLPQPEVIGSGNVVAAVLAVALLGALVVVWRLRRADQRALEAARLARLELPDRLSFDGLDDA